jgi:5'-methylthioadenosine phosphorylase
MNVKVGLIGGTGMGEALLGISPTKGREIDTPFGKPSAPIIEEEIDGVPVAVLPRHGIGHTLMPSDVPYRANIFAMKLLGITHIISTGATGSLRERIQPGHLVIPDQVIDRTTNREKTFFEGLVCGHVEMADPFCLRLRQLLADSAPAAGTRVHEEGTYICMEGPQFSTRAESLMHIQMGGDVIGMTCIPEPKLAREAEICYSLIALPTDYDCWRPHSQNLSKQTLLGEIIENLNRVTDSALKLIRAVLPKIKELDNKDMCPDRSALELAIWTDKKHISEEAKKTLEPLIGKYVQ